MDSHPDMGGQQAGSRRLHATGRVTHTKIDTHTDGYIYT